MKIVPFKIPKVSNEFARFQVDDVKYFYDKLHQHPEIQLSYILKGTGKIIVGDYIGRFKEGDTFLLGSNIPHVFRCDSEYYDERSKKTSLMYSLFFDFHALPQGLWQVEELLETKDFFEKLKGCYKIKDKNTSGEETIINLIKKIKTLSGFSKIIKVFQVMENLMNSADIEKLNVMSELPVYSEKEGNRMGDVMQFTINECYRNISLDEISLVACMSKEAFCRFFKERTRKTYTTFLNEIRISNACNLLQHTDQTIAGIAYSTGFSNLSHFNRFFKKITNTTPNNYRKSFKADLQLG
jgi:AraC-like DNA-binding protein